MMNIGPFGSFQSLAVCFSIDLFDAKYCPACCRHGGVSRVISVLADINNTNWSTNQTKPGKSLRYSNAFLEETLF